MKPYAPEIIPIVRPLAASRRRLRLLASLRGLFTLFWTSLAAVLFGGLADYLLHIAAPVRVVMLCLFAAYFLYGLVAWVARPLFARISLDTIAARVEQQNPWLQDRLRSALLFGSSRVEGSEELQRLVLQETLHSLEKIDVSQVTDERPLRRAMIYSVAPMLILTLLAWFAPAYLQIGIDRIFAPLHSTQWPKSVQIELISGLPENVPVGQRLELSAKLSKGDRPSRQVIVSWQIGDGPIQRQLMQRNEAGTYDVAIDVRPPMGVDSARMHLWVEAGDDAIGPLSVGLVPRLQVSGMAAEIQPPAYCGLEDFQVNLRQQAASVPVGSQLKLTIDFSRPVRSVEFQPVGASEALAVPQITWAQVDEDTYTASWLVMDSLRFRVRARDESGYGNPGAEEFEIIARPDQQPVVQLETPRRSEERTPEATVPLIAIAEDDYGIASMALEARLLSADLGANAGSPEPVSLPLVEDGSAASAEVQFTRAESDSRRARMRMAYDWRLLSFPSSLLRPGDVIEFTVSAKDRYNLNGESHPAARTPPLRITIISQEQLLQRAYDELRQVATQLSEMKSRQDRLRGDTTQLRDDLANKSAPDDADRMVASRISEQQTRLASQSREAANRLSDIARRLQENASPNEQLRETAAQAGRQLEQISASVMQPAANDVKQAVAPGMEKEARNAEFTEAEQKQKEASEQLSRVLDSLGDVGGIARAIDMIQELLSAQRKTSEQTEQFGREHAGQRPEDLSKEDREALERIANEQRSLSQRTENTLEQLRNMAQRQGAQDEAAAEALRQAAQTGQQQSVSQHQQRASEAVSQNQSAQASSAQQSAEAGLQQMLDSLKEAQRRKLEELARKLASMQEQLRHLVRRQAGHNLDNLVLREQTGGEFAELASALLSKAGRQQMAVEGLTHQQLAASQQQTHVNTSDLVEQLDKLRGTGEVAGHLGRAVNRMERAVALLRQQKLEEALNPHQTEALAELERALESIADLRKEAEEQGKNDQKEKLRKAYEAIRDRQVQITEATRVLDESLATDRKRRSDLVRLAQVAAEQQKLADMLRPLTQQLADLGSSIFVRTSESIGRDMVKVSGILSQQQTGRVVQLSQTQIVARLEAIIRGLTDPEQEESKYATRSGGGGDGGGQGSSGRQLPPAAELILIRDLQELVNNATRQLKEDDDEGLFSFVADHQKRIRSAFDELIENASPDTKMPDEEESRELVPEETEAAPDADFDALDAELLLDAPPEEENPDLQLIGRRMTRSQVRLGEDKDPGPVTQLVQERIIRQLDKIIEEASRNQQQRQQQQRSSQQQGKPNPNADPSQDSSSQQNQQAGQSSNPAQQSRVTPGGQAGEPSGDIRETAKDWGGLSDRQRQAIIESAGEDMIEKYRRMTEDYYRALSIKATENK